MKINAGFIKLLLTAILCDVLLSVGFVLIKFSYVITFKYGLSADTIGFMCIFIVSGYVCQHELRAKHEALIATLKKLGVVYSMQELVETELTTRANNEK